MLSFIVRKLHFMFKNKTYNPVLHVLLLPKCLNLVTLLVERDCGIRLLHQLGG